MSEIEQLGRRLDVDDALWFGGDDILDDLPHVVWNLLDAEIGKTISPSISARLGSAASVKSMRPSEILSDKREMIGDFASGRDAVRRDVETLEGPVRVAVR